MDARSKGEVKLLLITYFFHFKQTLWSATTYQAVSKLSTDMNETQVFLTADLEK